MKKTKGVEERGGMERKQVRVSERKKWKEKMPFKFVDDRYQSETDAINIKSKA